MKSFLNFMPASSLIRKHEVLLLSLFFFLVNFILKVLFLSGNEVALDEPFSIYYAQMDLSSILAMLRTENNPGLHFILLHFWIKLFGTGAFSVRFLSLIFSSLTATVIFLTGQKFFSRQTGILGALIFTFSVFHVYFSHEARVYPLFVFLTTASLYFFLSLVARPGRWRYLFALITVNALLIYSHYFGFIVLITEFLSVFVCGNTRRIWKQMVLAWIALVILYIPNILVFFLRFSVSVTQGTWVRKAQVSELYGNLNRFLNSKTTMIALLVIAGAYLVLLLRKKQLAAALSGFFKNPFARILILWFALPYLGMFFISFWVPMFLDRYILFTSVSFYLLIAVCITGFNMSKTISIASSALLLAVMLGTFRLAPDNNRRVERVVQVVKELKEKDPDAVVIISPGYTYLEFTYHYNIRYFNDYRNTMSLLHAEDIFPLNDLGSFDKTKLAGKKIIFLDSGTDFAFGRNAILQDLNSGYERITCVPVYEIYKIYWFKSRS